MNVTKIIQMMVSLPNCLSACLIGLSGGPASWLSLGLSSGLSLWRDIRLNSLSLQFQVRNLFLISLGEMKAQV